MPVSCVLYPRKALRSRSRTLDGEYEGLVEPALGVRNLLSLAIDAVVMAILIQTSAILVTSFDNIAIKYLKLVTYSSFSPLMLLVVLFTMTFSAITFILHVPALS
ncbi:hypothetical protein DPMN_050245 [Dreissena polymorpha]|uniref:Uncharacterized protein n=1 Tax=Dreissena polymorpha TaxID=45954 RepID=A0A9D4CFR9_DREPO|nr:hypothetical protein DPMN_050245 [Dreissena polymorpha]